MTHTTAADLSSTAQAPMADELMIAADRGTLPESIAGLLRMFREEALVRIPDTLPGKRDRLEVTVREIDLVLAEMRDPVWRGRPLWPRAVRVIARMIEDGLL